MPKSKVERTAQLLDDKMRVHVTSLRVCIHIRSTDIRALDAAASLAGLDAVRGYPGQSVDLRCGKQGAILDLLQQCIPFMREQRELAEAVVAFVKADTARGMLDAMLDIWKLRRSGRRGRGTW